ncbi:MAG: penicillin-binding protein 1C [Bacteroidales bacterium]|nr:penicillin-binding protein 1C [Bacteroidales bacterium]
MRNRSKGFRAPLVAGSAVLGLFLLFLCVPVPKFDDPYSTVLTAKDGTLLGAHIADDGQWRFPASNSYSPKYVACVLEFEDQQFFRHIGFNPVAFFQAMLENYRAGKVVRGGSTISMQVVRLARKDKPRTYGEKLLEVILAMRLELRYSKRSILDLYAAHAPFGGNVVGIDAAAWRYFHTTPDQLSWSEAATLAVLPNSPAMIHPGKSRDRLLDKRDALMQRVCTTKVRCPKRWQVPSLSRDDYELAMLERLPDKPYEMPQLAYHYLMEQEKRHKGEQIHSDLDRDLQQAVNDIMTRHYQINTLNEIENAAVYVVDYLADEVVAYAGNHLQAKEGAMVDMVKAQRSTGSIMKPFLFAAMLDEGTLLPTMLVPDVPMYLSGFTPKNYSGQYWGAVPANTALQHSLNAPFVYLQKQHGTDKFHSLLKRLNLSGIVFDSEHYGLSLIVGGAEASLFDLVNTYARMGRKLAAAVNEGFDEDVEESIVPFSADAIAITFDVMKGLTRPSSQIGWSGFSSSKQLAWKTGTSYGFRDAWAIGLTDRYAIGVWVGNADGEGRPGLTGVGTAAPVLFDVATVLKDSYTYPPSSPTAIEVEVCQESGYPPSEYCKHTKKVMMPDVEVKTGVCPYHRKVFLDESGQYQVLPDCYPVDQKRYENYFVLPPVQEMFYKRHTAKYRPLPAMYPECATAHPDDLMAFVYPKSDAHVTIPIGIRGDKQQVVFEIAHRNPKKHIYWTLNDVFIGTTWLNHQMPIDVEKGVYNLRCVDEDGVELYRKVVVN